VPRFSKIAIAVAAAVTLGVAIQQRHRVVLKLQDPLGGHINDFDRWMMMTPKFIHDEADYVDDLLPTPPVSLLLLAPFTALSRPNAQFAWVCVKLPLAYVVFVWCAALVKRCGARLTTAAMALVLAGWWLPVVIDMQEGQINLIVFLPLVAALYVAQDDTHGSDVVSGGLIGLAAAIKVTPLVFAAYFCWKRRWVIALSTMVSVLFWTLVVPSIVFGWDQNVRWLGQWVDIMIVPYVTRGEVLYPMSQSFGSFALRLLTPLPIFETLERQVPYGHYMNVLALGERFVGRLIVGLMVIIGMAGLVWMRRRMPTWRSERYLFELSGVTAFVLWFSERTWVHHYVSFLIVLCAAAAVVSDPNEGERTRRALHHALMVFAGVTLFASDLSRIFGPHGDEWALALGVFLWPSVLVFVVLFWAAQRRGVHVDAVDPVAICSANVGSPVNGRL
jgi:alpha-1,2-mannosyltransferase